MRLSSFQVHNQAASQLQSLSSNVATKQEQISFGKRLVKPADDPVGAARVISINQEIEARGQFLKNADAADAQLALEDSVLDKVGELIQRVQELTLQAGSAIVGREDRKFIAEEIAARYDELLSLANTRNSTGQFIFGGFKADTPPFERTGETVEYLGDEGRRQIQVDRGLFLTLNDSGAGVFMDIAAPVTNVELALESTGGSSLSNLVVADQAALDDFYPGEVMVEFRPEAEAGGTANFTVKRVADGRVLDGLANIPYTGQAEIAVAGLAFVIDGQAQAGDRFVLSTTNKQSLFDTFGGIAETLREVDVTTQPDKFRTMVDKTIAGLAAATETIARTRADIGGRFSSIESVKTLHEDVNLQLTEVRSGIEDLDFAEAVSDLAYQSFVLEAAQQSFLRIRDLSLFNRL